MLHLLREERRRLQGAPMLMTERRATTRLGWKAAFAGGLAACLALVAVVSGWAAGPIGGGGGATLALTIKVGEGVHVTSSDGRGIDCRRDVGATAATGTCTIRVLPNTTVTVDAAATVPNACREDICAPEIEMADGDVAQTGCKQPSFGAPVRCSFVFIGDGSIAAFFSNDAARNDKRLDLKIAGDGAGVVSSAPAGLTCSTSCTKQANLGSIDSDLLVLLTGVPDQYSTLSRWTGCATNPSPTSCVPGGFAVGPLSVTFVLNRFALGVSVGGSGKGVVTSADGSINCGSLCAATVSRQVTLTAAAAAGSTFSGWSGDCSGTATACVLSMTKARSVRALFDPAGAPTPPAPTPTPTPTPTTPAPAPPTPAPPQPAGNQLAARVVYAVVAGKPGHRRLVLRIRVSESATAQVRLVQKGFERAQGIFPVKPAGNTLALPLPASLRAGVYRLAVTLRDKGGRQKTFTATVAAPA
jgi:Divergent InlB B-repeat domain